GTADRNRSHWSTSKTPSYTKSVSWQHHQSKYLADTQHSDLFTEIAEFKNLKLPVLIRETSCFFCKFI
ncbi:hypothetical protein, partial [Escherichia coli]|uniref:hypothetical protein n=1 Tax=Escherichia coli TaxID=562 RepID=UPI00288342CE